MRGAEVEDARRVAAPARRETSPGRGRGRRTAATRWRARRARSMSMKRHAVIVAIARRRAGPAPRPGRCSCAGVSASRRSRSPSGRSSSVSMNACIASRVIALPRVSSFSCSYGSAQAVAAHHRLDRLGEHLPGGVEVGVERAAVDLELAEAARQRVVGRAARSRARRPCCAAPCCRSGRAGSARSAASGSGASSSALARPKLPSAFSKSIGLTLCGIVIEPTSPALRALLEVAEADVAPDVARTSRSGSCWRASTASNSSAIAVVRLDLDRVRVEARGRAAARRRGARTPPSRSPGRRRGGRCSCRPRRSSSPAA